MQLVWIHFLGLSPENSYFNYQNVVVFNSFYFIFTLDNLLTYIK
jgi:hypothetical protein